jgi:hypothetical protein
MPRGRRAGDDLPDLGRELRRNPLVGIDFEDPVTVAGVDPSMATRSLALPGTLDEPLCEAASDLARPVTAAVEDNDDIVGKTETGEAFGQLPLFVMNYNQGGEAGSSRPIHAAALATERHS